MNVQGVFNHFLQAPKIYRVTRKKFCDFDNEEWNGKQR